MWLKLIVILPASVPDLALQHYKTTNGPFTQRMVEMQSASVIELAFSIWHTFLYNITTSQHQKYQHTQQNDATGTYGILRVVFC